MIEPDLRAFSQAASKFSMSVAEFAEKATPLFSQLAIAFDDAMQQLGNALLTGEMDTGPVSWSRRQLRRMALWRPGSGFWIWMVKREAKAIVATRTWPSLGM